MKFNVVNGELIVSYNNEQFICRNTDVFSSDVPNKEYCEQVINKMIEEGTFSSMNSKVYIVRKQG